jgi:hypothetical protein
LAQYQCLTNGSRLWGKNKSAAVMSRDGQLMPYVSSAWIYLEDESVLGLLLAEDVESQESIADGCRNTL